MRLAAQSCKTSSLEPLANSSLAGQEHGRTIPLADLRRSVPFFWFGWSLTEVTHELAEITRHRAAISEVLRAIASSPHDLQPIFDTIVDSAIRLCQANGSSFRLQEEGGFRLVALKGDPDVLDQWSPPILTAPDSIWNELAGGGSPVHVPDLAAHEVYYQGAVTRALLGRARA